MTKRKPSGMSFESFAERQIREAQEAGEFDNLPGTGKPIPGLDRPHDPLWWQRKLLQREGLEFLPPALEVRRDVERALDRLWRLPTEGAVRRRIAELNARILKANATTTAGPATNLSAIDADAALKNWRLQRAARKRPRR